MCAVGAFGKVIPQTASFLAAETPVDRLRDRDLRVGARELVLELLRERAARPEEERLERRGRDAENVGDLGIRAALELPENDRLTLLGRDLRERGEQLADAGAILVDVRPRDALVELDGARPRLLLSKALLDRVARDGQEPVGRLAGVDPLLERAIRIEERRLRDVFGVGVVADHCVRVPIDLRPVSPIEGVDGARRVMTRLRDGHV